MGLKNRGLTMETLKKIFNKALYETRFCYKVLGKHAENIPQDTPGSHAPAWEFIRQRSSVTVGIPTPERGNDRVGFIYCELP